MKGDEMTGQWIIKGPKGYVALAGSKHSYTRSLKRIRRYTTREAAIADKCGNEIVMSIYDLL